MKHIMFILSRIREYWLMGTVIASIGTVIATTAINFERKRIIRARESEDLRFVKDSTLHYLMKFDKKIDQFDTRLHRIDRKQNEISDQLDEQGRAIRATQKSFMDHVSKDPSLTKEDFLKYMNDLEYSIKKNLGSENMLIQSEQKWTR